MTIYCTRQNYLDEFGAGELLQALDRDRDGIEDAGVFDDMQLRAAGEIEARLALRYTLPLPLVPDNLRRIALDIVRYRIHAHLDFDAVRDIRARYQDARRDLDDLASGRAQLDLPPVPGEQPGGELKTDEILDGDSPPRLFSRATLAGF